MKKEEEEAMEKEEVLEKEKEEDEEQTWEHPYQEEGMQGNGVGSDGNSMTKDSRSNGSVSDIRKQRWRQ